MPDGSQFVSVSCTLVANVKSRKNENKNISVIHEKICTEQRELKILWELIISEVL